MNHTATIDLSRNGPLRWFLGWIGLGVVWLAVDVLVALLVPDGSLRLWTAYLTPMATLVAAALLFRLPRPALCPKGRIAAALGGAFIVGATGLDLASTLLINPDLTLEGNPYLRALLDRGHSLRFVYAHLAVTQGAFVALFLGAWGAFLRQLPVLLGAIAETRPATRLEFLKSATGGAHLTTRQWLLPLRVSELPRLYHCVWPLAVAIVFGVSLLRWYVALEWLDLFEPNIAARGAVLFVGLSIALVVYFLALARLHATRCPSSSG